MDRYGIVLYKGSFLIIVEQSHRVRRLSQSWAMGVLRLHQHILQKLSYSVRIPSGWFKRQDLTMQLYTANCLQLPINVLIKIFSRNCLKRVGGGEPSYNLSSRKLVFAKARK